MNVRNSCKIPVGILIKMELTDYNFLIGIVQFSSVQSLSRVQLFATP